MIARYLGLIDFDAALKAEDAACLKVAAGSRPLVLGFESRPVVTLGIRGDAAVDLTLSEAELNERGFALTRVARGGQATLHNPGQLVIFPIVPIEKVRPWIDLLAEVTRDTLGEFGVDSRWDACKPGLYTPQGKIVAIGLKIRQGISTHGLAINISNRLEDFALIRPCGEAQMQLDRFPRPAPLEDVFATWCGRLTSRLDQTKKTSDLMRL